MALPIPVIPLPPVGPVAATAVPPMRPITYRELMSDEESNSPSPDWVANYLQGYCFDGAGGIPTPAT
jgi:hypothetical protein